MHVLCIKSAKSVCQISTGQDTINIKVENLSVVSQITIVFQQNLGLGMLNFAKLLLLSKFQEKIIKEVTNIYIHDFFQRNRH